METTTTTSITQPRKALFCDSVTRDCQEANVSSAVTQFLHDNIPQVQQESHEVRIAKWISFCQSWKADPLLPTIGLVADYLLELQKAFVWGKTVAKYLAVLPDYWSPKYSFIMESPIIRKVVEVSKQLKPIIPELPHTMWDPDKVLNFIMNMPPNDKLEPQVLAGKLIVLLLLSSGHRKSDLMKMDTRPQFMLRTEEAYYFALNAPSKGYRNEAHAFMQYVEVRKYSDNEKICPYMTLDDYFKYLHSYPTISHHSLLVITVPPFSPASNDSVRRWGNDLLRQVGVPAAFKLHSAWSVHASKSHQLGDTLDEIMKRCAWAQLSTFFNHYL